MKTAFRQGIYRFQKDPDGTPNYLLKSANDNRYIDLNVNPDPCVILFAHGTVNYKIEETKYVKKAWGPFQPLGQTQYLYWDIDTYSGQLTRGFTSLEPFVSRTPPDLIRDDQHWFDLKTNKMMCWNGETWIEKIRVFAGVYNDSAMIHMQPEGSQVGLDNIRGVAGAILFDSRLRPVRTEEKLFLTTETNFHVKSANHNADSSIKFEGIQNYVKAAEFIPEFSCVSYAAHGVVKLANTVEKRMVNGIVTEDMFKDDLSRIITAGIIYNEQWNFSTENIGKPVFCGNTGEITLTPPVTGMVQIVGHVETAKEIVVNILTPFFLKQQLMVS